ncbi:TRAP transporter small permease [Roseovarius indicus]|uniref:TRAP transporter small permease protein n=1 Tax=Roseovarius indicus TaxID=540747 RepID=A0A0T5P360_9RHOB|nr:TRAP transporter small permease [Roseovarius indicus]KRS15555.1 C4-dicarboxylate ABC transporter permease [Roseovarius indicus]QEW25246.1 2,3-diketo-L-gulonate TRAP transporter small permease protein YiaM [Roseovarius indicus]SFE19260.1 TRAP-type C4-dicarboxylate transport system, small permease component [Roseovarius indicus]
MIGRISAVWARLELTLAAFLAVSITLLILLNVVTRSMGAALYWVDELAIYAMAWMTFLGASAALHHGQTVVVTALTDPLPPAMAKIAAKLVDVIVLAFALFMLWFCWRWYAPLELAKFGFDIEAFQGATFNFIYAEPTTTLGIPKFWIWMVMWIFALGATLHGIANLIGQGQKPQEKIA